MPAGRYLFIPFLLTKSQKRQTKNRIKKTDRTNIIAKNFVRGIQFKLGLEPATFLSTKPPGVVTKSLTSTFILAANFQNESN